jgi:hypothetical protein
MDLSTLRINKKIPFASTEKDIYKLIGRPDSVSVLAVGLSDTTIIVRIKDFAFRKERDTLFFYELDVTPLSQNYLMINNIVINNISSSDLKRTFISNEGNLDSSEKDMEIVWCELTDHLHADLLKFTFQKSFLIKVETWIDD